MIIWVYEWVCVLLTCPRWWRIGGFPCRAAASGLWSEHLLTSAGSTCESRQRKISPPCRTRMHVQWSRTKAFFQEDSGVTTGSKVQHRFHLFSSLITKLSHTGNLKRNLLKFCHFSNDSTPAPQGKTDRVGKSCRWNFSEVHSDPLRWARGRLSDTHWQETSGSSSLAEMAPPSPSLAALCVCSLQHRSALDWTPVCWRPHRNALPGARAQNERETEESEGASEWMREGEIAREDAFGGEGGAEACAHSVWTAVEEGPRFQRDEEQKKKGARREVTARVRRWARRRICRHFPADGGKKRC